VAMLAYSSDLCQFVASRPAPNLSSHPITFTSFPSPTRRDRFPHKRLLRISRRNYSMPDEPIKTNRDVFSSKSIFQETYRAGSSVYLLFREIFTLFGTGAFSASSLWGDASGGSPGAPRDIAKSPRTVLNALTFLCRTFHSLRHVARQCRAKCIDKQSEARLSASSTSQAVE
jgi:hypothetical protein